MTNTIRWILSLMFFASATFHSVSVSYPEAPMGIVEPIWEHCLFIFVNVGLMSFTVPYAKADPFVEFPNFTVGLFLAFSLAQVLEHTTRLAIEAQTPASAVQNVTAIVFALALNFLIPLLVKRVG